jgi:KDO2-lipid IV(A) lauroyltransferase
MKFFFSFLVIRLITFPISLLPYRSLHLLGNLLGSIAYYVMPTFRKRALSNLALAFPKSEKEIRKLAKESFQNLMITCLEYPKFAREKRIGRVAICRNPEKADAIMKEGRGVIFFCGHQANWEVLFLEGTSRMQGVAIGRPIKNNALYNWVLAMRQQYGGKIITPRNAIREGLRSLKKGAFLGIVGDQGMPDSGFCSPFFGIPAWTSPVPAILSYRTGVPIIVATTLREKGKYWINYSSPIYPNQEASMESEVERMMRLSLRLLEESIRKRPGQWLWQHNRWKQQTAEKVKRPYRQDTFCILLPNDPRDFEAITPHLGVFREIYPREFITLLVPSAFAKRTLLPNAEIRPYEAPDELLLSDLRYKLVFDFANHPKAKAHYLGRSTLTFLKLEDLEKGLPLSEALKKKLCHAH